MPIPAVAPSAVTCSLVELLVSRDAFGQKKYGSSLDRKDFSIEEWLDHQTEELLDGAGYAQAAKREIALMQSELKTLRLLAAEHNILLRSVRSFAETMEHGNDRMNLLSLLRINDADVTLRKIQAGRHLPVSA